MQFPKYYASEKTKFLINRRYTKS